MGWSVRKPRWCVKKKKVDNTLANNLSDFEAAYLQFLSDLEAKEAEKAKETEEIEKAEEDTEIKESVSKKRKAKEQKV